MGSEDVVCLYTTLKGPQQIDQSPYVYSWYSDQSPLADATLLELPKHCLGGNVEKWHGNLHSYQTWNFYLVFVMP